MNNLATLLRRLGAAVLLLLLPALGRGQTTLVNFDFNAGTSYATLAPATAGGVTATPSSTEAFATFAGAATTAAAFTGNATAGNALAMNNSSGTNTKYFQFQLGGASLNTYSGYKLYFQAQRSTSGAQTATVAYSTDGTAFTNFVTTYTVPTTFGAFVVDLSAVTALNLQTSVYFRILVSGATGTGTLRLDNFQVQGTSGTPAPALAATPASLGGFGSVAGGGPSAPQSYGLGGSNLSGAPGNVLVTAPTGYEVSLASGGFYTSTLNVAYASATLAATPVFVRLQGGLAAAPYAGNVTNAGGGATLNVAVSGTVAAPPTPTITTSQSTRTGFGYVAGGGPSATQTYNVSGTALTPAAADLTVTAPTDYEVSLNNGGPFAATLALPYTGGALAATPVYVRLKTGLAVGTYNGQLVSHGGGGAAAVTVTLSGAVTAPAAATLAVSPAALTGFGYVLGTGPSASQLYNVSGANLTGFPGTLTVTAPAAYEVSADDVTFGPTAAVPYAGATLAATAVYVRLKAGLAVATYNSQLVANAGGGAATARNVTVSGAVTAAPAATLTVSPGSRSGFLYTAGSGPSASQSYSLSGTTLAPATGTLTATAPADYEVSADDVTFGPTAAIAYAGGALAATPVFVRLKTGLAVGTYNGQLVANAGGGAAPKNVTVSGAVSAAGGACVSEGFGTALTSLPANFTFTGISAGAGGTYGSDFGVAAPALRFDATGDALTTPGVSNPASLSFWLKGQGTMTGSSFVVEGFDGAAYTNIATIAAIPTTGTTFTYSGLSNAFINIRFRYLKGNGNVAFDDLTVNCGAGTPAITTSLATLALGTTGVGIAGSPQSFDVRANDLTAPLVVTAPAGVQVSLSTAPASFGASVSVAPGGGSVTTRPVFVRLAAQAAGAVAGTVALASGATTAAVAVSGTVAAATVFYYGGTGDLNDFTRYGLNADGTGTNPGGFAGAGFTYVVTGTTGTLGANWAVLGAGSKVVLTAGATMTIPAGFTFSGPLEQGANSTLVIANASAGAISGITQLAQDPTSTIDLAQAGAYPIPPTLTYRNLKLTNGAKLFGGNFAAAITVNGNLTLDNVQVGGSITNSTTAAANYSAVKLAGDLIQLANTTYDATRSFTLQLIGTTATQTIYGNGFGPVQVYRLLDTGVSTTPPAAASISNTLANAQRIALSGVAYGTTTPASTVLTVANLFTGGVLLANQFSSLTLNDNTTLRFVASGGGNFFTAHRGRLRLIDGCNLEFNRATTSTFLLGNLFIDPNFNTCRTLLLNSTAGGGANTLTLLGDLNVTGLVTLSNGTLVIGPNTLNLTGTLSASTGGFLNGSSASNLTVGGTGAFGSLAFAPGFQVLQNLVLNRSGGATLVLDAPLVVGNTLDLSAGIVQTTATNLLTLSYNATGGLLGGSAGSYVNGPLARGTTTGAATVLFPIGKGAAYRPLTLNTATQTSARTYTAEQFEATARTSALTDPGSGLGSAAAPLTRVSGVRYFTLSPDATTGTYAGTATLSFGADDFVNYPAEASFVVAKRSTAPVGPWGNVGRTAATGTAAAGAPVPGTLTSDTFTGFSDFALASTAPAGNNALNTSNPLPVELLTFAAARTAAGPVALAWATASERHSAWFEIERSLDGRTFGRIGRVAAQGSSSKRTAYAYLDDQKSTNSPTHQSTTYYRLRQVDADGSAAYSAVRIVQPANAPIHQLTVYPNPARTALYVDAAPGAAYRLLALTGRVLAAGPAAATGPTALPVAALPPGTYLLELTTAASRQVRKFTKE